MRGKRLVGVSLCAALVVLGLVACSGSSSAGAVTLESANASGADPFSTSVAIGPAAAFPANVQAIAASKRKTLKSDTQTKTLVASGTAPGLYGGSGDVHVCNASQLVAFLQQNPTKAAAWAGVLGVPVANIASYVASLTPVLLMSDTRVTNHGYANGRATTLQSVLQAGTAVMVDNTGTPRVKCNCGNPLTPPEPLDLSDAHTHGSAWPGYSGTNVTTVQAGAPVIQITIVNVTTGDTYTQPVGSTSSPSTVPPLSGTPPCSEATLWFGVTQGVPPNEKPGLHLDKFQCSGEWAYASWQGESGGTFSTVLHFDTGKLLGEWVVDAGACGQGTVPAAIASAGCNGGASSATPPTTSATVSSAPCTTAAIQSDLNIGSSPNTTVQSVKCFGGDYAQVFTTNGHEDGTFLIHWDGSQWASDEQACNAPQPPPGLSTPHWHDACSTTG